MSASKPMVLPAVTEVVVVLEALARAPTLQRRSSLVTSVTGELALVLVRMLAYSAPVAPLAISLRKRSGGWASAATHGVGEKGEVYSEQKPGR